MGIHRSFPEGPCLKMLEQSSSFDQNQTKLAFTLQGERNKPRKHKDGRNSRWRCENNPGLKLSVNPRRGMSAMLQAATASIQGSHFQEFLMLCLILKPKWIFAKLREK
ncbi:uncharacterized protein LOC144579144 isoform X2 [Callithrix jacchus]